MLQDIIVAGVISGILALIFFIHAIKVSKLQLPQFDAGDPDSIERWKKFKTLSAVLLGFGFLAVIPAVAYVRYLKQDDVSVTGFAAILQAHPFLSVAVLWALFFIMARLCSHTANLTGVHVKEPEPYVPPVVADDEPDEKNKKNRYSNNDDDENDVNDDDDPVYVELTESAKAAFDLLIKHPKIDDIKMNASSDDFASFICELSAMSAESEDDIIVMMTNCLNGTTEQQLKYATFLYELNYYHEALPWLEILSAKDNPDASFLLGFMHSEGFGVETDLEKAFDLFYKAAESGHIAAMNNLGWMYLNGLSVDKDYAMALEWYQKAAAHNDPWAFHEIGKLYEAGLGVTANASEAFRYYKRSAELDFVPAYLSLADSYRFGKGTAIDEIEAVKWFTILQESTKSLEPALMDMIKRYEIEIPDETFEAGQQRAQEWLDAKKAELRKED